MKNCKLKYKCVVLDHDDTVVETSKDIHYPSFVKSLSVLRPRIKIGFNEFMKYCFSPGFFAFLKENLKYTDEEIKYQLDVWKKDVSSVVPKAYDGVNEIILKIKELSGIIVVVSHSDEDIILRDYKENFGVLPDAVFDGSLPDDKRKPSVYPLEKTAEIFSVEKKDIVVIDDLKPGMDMAKNFGADFYAAGWSHFDEETKRFLKENADGYLERVSDLKNVLFEYED